MRIRAASRIIVIDPADRILLFRFVYTRGPIAGADYWAPPGGEVEPGETYEQAAIRELHEETGLHVEDVGAPVAAKQFEMRISTGEPVLADERFFLVRTAPFSVSGDRWTELEREIVAAHRWWSHAEVRGTDHPVYPADLLDMIGTSSAG